MISTHHIVVTSLVAGRSQPILDEITLSLRPSTITVMIGPNGAGKSTLLRVMAGLIRPKTGSVILHHGDHQFHLYGDLPHADAHREQNCDRAPHQTLPLRPRFFRRFSMMNFLKETRDPKVSKTVSWYGDSSPIVFPYSVEDLVMMGRFAHHQGWPKAHDRACVQEALGELGIEDLRHRLAPTLSSGELQKTMLARAFASDPRVLLLDEPASHLDPAGYQLLASILRKKRSQGTAMAVVLHDLTWAVRLADEIILLDRGRLTSRIDDLKDLREPGPCRELKAAEIQTKLSSVFHVNLAWAVTGGEPILWVREDQPGRDP